MAGNHMASTGADRETRGFRIGDNVRGAIIVVLGAAAMVGLAFGVMVVLTSPDGWVSRIASQAVATAEQGTLASYDFAAQ